MTAGRLGGGAPLTASVAFLFTGTTSGCDGPATLSVGCKDRHLKHQYFHLQTWKSAE